MSTELAVTSESLITVALRRSRFLFRMAKLHFWDVNRTCPYCQSAKGTTEDRKFFILELRKCLDCGLKFRIHKDSSAFNTQFYQKGYRQIGLTTDLPSENELKKLLDSNFKGTEKNFASKIAILKQILPVGRVLDYGCSWGYGVIQLKHAGYEAEGFELSKPRAHFGEQAFGVRIMSDLQDLQTIPDQRYDAIMTSHVLEHLPDLRNVFSQFYRWLKPGGALCIWVPNGSGRDAEKQGVRWGPSISEKHTLLLTTEFLGHALPREKFKILAFSDSDHTPLFSREKPSLTLNPAGEELLTVAVRVD